MLKKILINTSLVLIFLLAFLFAFNSSEVNAQTDPGFCTCTGILSGPCTIEGVNNCNTGFRPTCDSGSATCTYPGCTCVEEKATDCGGAGEPCCTTGSECNANLDPVTTSFGCTCTFMFAGNCGYNSGGYCTIYECPYGYLGGEPSCEWPTHCCTNSPMPNGFNPGEELCEGDTGIDTAIGCLTVDNTDDTTSDLLKWATGVGGGIAFILMVFGGFIMITGSGNPQRIQAGRELFIGAASGLLLIVMSVFILRFIGVDIFGLSGL